MLPESLRIPAFRRIVAASMLSTTGSLMTFVVLPIVAWQETGSGATFGLVMTGGSIGMLLAMPFGGVIADRHDRRSVMLVGDLVAMTIMSLMLLAVSVEAWWALPFVSMGQTALGSLFASAGPALRRDVLPDELRTQGNAIHSGGSSAASLLGPILGGVLFASFGFATVVLVDLASFAASFLLVLGVAKVGIGERQVDGAGPGGMARLRADLAGGLELTRRDAYLRIGIFGNLACGAANGFLLVACVPWLDDTLHMSTSSWGYIIAIMGGTSLAGSLLVARIGERIASWRLVQLGAACFAAGALLLLGSPGFPRLAAAFALIGCTNAAMTIAATTITQRRVPASHMGRTSSLQMLAHQLTQGSATAAAAAVIAAVGPAATIHLAVAGFVVASVLYWHGGRVSERVPAPGEVADADLAVSA